MVYCIRMDLIPSQISLLNYIIYPWRLQACTINSSGPKKTGEIKQENLFIISTPLCISKASNRQTFVRVWFCLEIHL